MGTEITTLRTYVKDIKDYYPEANLCRKRKYKVECEPIMELTCIMNFMIYDGCTNCYYHRGLDCARLPMCGAI